MMRYFFSAVAILFFVNICKSQSLNVGMLEQLTDAPFEHIDEIMADGYGYFIRESDEENVKKYVKIFNKNVDSFISIDVWSSKSVRHSLKIGLGKDFPLRSFKDNIVEYGYLYQGMNKQDFYAYVKGNTYFLIPATPNEMGVYVIFMTYDL